MLHLCNGVLINDPFYLFLSLQGSCIEVWHGHINYLAHHGLIKLIVIHGLILENPHVEWDVFVQKEGSNSEASENPKNQLADKTIDDILEVCAIKDTSLAKNKKVVGGRTPQQSDKQSWAKCTRVKIVPKDKLTNLTNISSSMANLNLAHEDIEITGSNHNKGKDKMSR